MIPPSDSIGHHSRKLAEFAASIQNRSRGAAPPPYSSTPAVPINEETFGSFDDDLDDGLETQLPPITVKIDASINVDGQGNTIVMPPSPSAMSTTTAGSSSIQTSSPSSPTSAPSSPSPVSTTSPSSAIQQLQQQQKTKSAQLVQTIISALQASGALENQESGKQRPLDINVNAGINIKGSKNVVCVGVPAKVEGKPETPGDSVISRKRRADSEPLEPPHAKRALC